MKAYAGIDLHSSTNFTAVIDDQDQRLYGRRLPNTMTLRTLLTKLNNSKL